MNSLIKLTNQNFIIYPSTYKHYIFNFFCYRNTSYLMVGFIYHFRSCYFVQVFIIFQLNYTSPIIDIFRYFSSILFFDIKQSFKKVKASGSATFNFFLQNYQYSWIKWNKVIFLTDKKLVTNGIIIYIIRSIFKVYFLKR